MITFKSRFSVYFDTSSDLALFHTSLCRIKEKPLTVNLCESDFSPDEWNTISYITDLTRRGSFFELDEPYMVNNFFSIIEKVKNRRRKAGFRKLDFGNMELKIWNELYDLLPMEDAL